MNCGCRRDETSADDHYDVIQESYRRGYQAGRESLLPLLEGFVVLMPTCEGGFRITAPGLINAHLELVKKEIEQ
jgi:hypothetical protein